MRFFGHSREHVRISVDFHSLLVLVLILIFVVVVIGVVGCIVCLLKTHFQCSSNKWFVFPPRPSFQECFVNRTPSMSTSRPPLLKPANATSRIDIHPHTKSTGSRSVNPCPKMIWRDFAHSVPNTHGPQRERDNRTFQKEVVDRVVVLALSAASNPLSEKEDSVSFSHDKTFINPPNSPCRDPLGTDVQSHAKKLTSRMTDAEVYASIHHEPPLFQDETTMRRIPNHLHGSNLPYSHNEQHTSTPFSYPFPDAVVNEQGTQPVEDDSNLVHRVTPSTDGDRMQTSMPEAVGRLRESLIHDINTVDRESATYGLTANAHTPEYEWVSSCVARKCYTRQNENELEKSSSPSAVTYYVWRDVYYRSGRTHGFQVEWTAEYDGDPLSQVSATARLVHGAVVGNYLPGEDDSDVVGYRGDGFVSDATPGFAPYVAYSSSSSDEPLAPPGTTQHGSQRLSDVTQTAVLHRIGRSRAFEQNAMESVHLPVENGGMMNPCHYHNNMFEAEKCASSVDEFGRPRTYLNNTETNK